MGSSRRWSMWGLTTLIGASMMAVTMSAIVGGAVSVGKAAVSAGGDAIGAAAAGSGGAARYLGIDANAALAPVNERLRAEGKPPLTSAQVQAVSRDIAQTAVRQGRLDRDLVVTALAQHTNLSAADAEEIGDRIQAQVQQAHVGDRLRSAAQQAQIGALKVGDATGKALWGVFGALLMGWIAALAGGAVGASREPGRPRRVRAAHPVAIATPREVHP